LGLILLMESCLDTPLMANTVVESCDVTFDETALVLVMFLSVQVKRKWRRSSL
jgi:hypothetical protein